MGSFVLDFFQVIRFILSAVVPDYIRIFKKGLLNEVYTISSDFLSS